MNKYYYDLHIHSCLSPCADDDNTPNNIAGMATLCGLNIVALTDHNSAKNCPAFFTACKRYGLIPIAGMELTTSEDIHIICLFEDINDALGFDKWLDGYRIPIKNRVEVYGQQMVLDGEDNLLEVVDNLLSNATTVSVDDVPSAVSKFNGICYPAHIDRQANGIIATLGTLPEIKGMASCVEFHSSEKIADYKQKYRLDGKKIIVSSDTHYLTDMRDENSYFLIDDEPYSSALVRKKVFEYLRGSL